MNANDALIDLLEDNRRRLHRVIGDMNDEVKFLTLKATREKNAASDQGAG